MKEINGNDSDEEVALHQGYLNNAEKLRNKRIAHQKDDLEMHKSTTIKSVKSQLKSKHPQLPPLGRAPSNFPKRTPKSVKRKNILKISNKSIHSQSVKKSDISLVFKDKVPQMNTLDRKAMIQTLIDHNVESIPDSLLNRNK
mmetsp:Transcript_21778/g.19294  ORF Transcript_21778/g.19294 Transcript_21778/m.19294 type:complete len:142 (+) Transcript_21778:336-761(+)